VYNAVLAEFIGRSRAVKADPAWQAGRALPRRSKQDRAARRAAFDAVAAAHGFTAGAAQSFASSLRQSWVREHLPAQETQNLGGRAFDAVRQWHAGSRGKPRFKNARRGLRSLSAKDGHGALRPKTDECGRLVGLQWGAGFVIPIAAPAATGRRGKEQQAELAEIEALIAAGKVLSARIVRAVINGGDSYRLQLVCDGCPTRRHRVGEGRVSFDLGPSQIAVAVDHGDGSWEGWIEPLADAIRLDMVRLRRVQRQLDRQHRAGSAGCFDRAGTHKSGRCVWQRSHAAARTAVGVAELHRRLGEHRKALHGRSTVADAVSKKIGTCFRPTWDCTSEQPCTGLIGWTCRQPAWAGCTVRTSTGRRGPVVPHHLSGEAAAIRHRGGPWRALKPGVTPKQRCDRAARREPPLPASPRR
jgi:hypothetical protein